MFQYVLYKIKIFFNPITIYQSKWKFHSDSLISIIQYMFTFPIFSRIYYININTKYFYGFFLWNGIQSTVSFWGVFFLSLLIMGSYPIFFLCNLLKKQDCPADNCIFFCLFLVHMLREMESMWARSSPYLQRKGSSV